MPSNLKILRVLLAIKEKSTAREIRKEANTTQSYAFYLLKKLEKLGLIKKEKNGNKYFYSLTEEGKLIKTNLEPILNKIFSLLPIKK